MNNHSGYSDGAALNTSEVLQNYSDSENNLINAYNLNTEENPFPVRKSLYYDSDGLCGFMTSHDEHLSVLSVNIQSLNAKFLELQTLITDWANNQVVFDVICLQETWLSSSDDHNLYNLEGYQMITKGHSGNFTSHGGLITYVKNNIKIKSVLKANDYTTWEGLITVVSTINKKSVPILNLYRPPSTTNRPITVFFDEFFPFISQVSQSPNDFVIIGDTNINLLNINVSKHQEFFDQMTNLQFLPKIMFPTRFTENSATLIDHIYCKNSPLSSLSHAGILLSSLSDHCPIFLTLDVRTKYKQPRPKFVTITQTKSDSFNNCVEEIKHQNFDPNITYESFLRILTHIHKKHFPTKRVRFNKSKHKLNKWITQGILISIKYRDKLYKKIKLTPHNTQRHNNLKQNLKTYNKILRRLITDAKKNYCKQEFLKSKNDMHKTWDTIKWVLNSSSNSDKSITCIKNANDILLRNPKEIADEFNTFFINIGSATPADSAHLPNYNSYLKYQVSSSFTFQLVSEDAIKTIIRNLKNNSSAGYDNLSSNLIKACPSLVPPITKIINQSLNTGIVPDQLKIAKVIPVYKNKDLDKEDLNSYRPISILPVISKILERVVYNQLYAYLTDNSLLYRHQYGFRPNHSTESAVLDLVDRLYNYLDSGYTPVSIFIDLSKAFDTLDHSILLQKLTQTI